MVELTTRAAMCEFFNRFNEVFQIDLDQVVPALAPATSEEGLHVPEREPRARRRAG